MGDHLASKKIGGEEKGKGDPTHPARSLTSALNRYTLSQYIEISFQSSDSVYEISPDQEVVFIACNEVNDLSRPAHTFCGSTPISTIPVHTDQFGLDSTTGSTQLKEAKIFSFQKRSKLQNDRHGCRPSCRVPVPHGQIYRHGRGHEKRGKSKYSKKRKMKKNFRSWKFVTLLATTTPPTTNSVPKTSRYNISKHQVTDSEEIKNPGSS